MKLHASSTIRLALVSEIKYDVFEANKPKILWEPLANTCQSKSLANRLFLKDLFGLTMEEDGDLRDHFNRFNGFHPTKQFKWEVERWRQSYSPIGVFTKEV